MTLTILTKPEWVFAWEYGLATAIIALGFGIVFWLTYTLGRKP